MAGSSQLHSETYRGLPKGSGPGSGGGNSAEVRFHTPRSLPTVIRPLPGPPPDSPRVPSSKGQGDGSGDWLVGQRDEEPAKFLRELPKLQPPELSTSAVCCGNWLAQVRQILVGLSPSASVWWSKVEGAATAQYQRWLIADPLDRLLLDPTGVRAEFSIARYQRVESRAVSLILASIPGNIRDEAVSNRWLSTTALVFRIMCLYQPGGASERSMLLSQLVNPDVAKSLTGAVGMLRRWQQHFSRVRELQAALPDSSLLLRGIDSATSNLLSNNPALGFKVNAFRNKVSLDYNPTILTVLQLVRLLQAEFEAAALCAEPSGTDKKARLAAASSGQELVNPKAPAVKPPPPPPPPSSEAVVRFLEGDAPTKGKGKGKEKGKVAVGDPGLCYNFGEGKGCKYGDACKFKHDRMAARRQKRCLSCGQEGHFRPKCPMAPLEMRQARQADPTVGPKVPPPRDQAPPKAKAKSAPLLKGVSEDAPTEGASASSTPSGAMQAQEALFAEAAKLLKGVTLKPLRLEDDRALEEGEGWFKWIKAGLKVL